VEVIDKKQQEQVKLYIVAFLPPAARK